MLRPPVRRLVRRLVLGRPQPPHWTRLINDGIASVDVGTYGCEAITVHDFRLPDGTWVGTRLSVGKYCSIAACDVFRGGNHRTEHVSQYPFASMYDLQEPRDDAYSNGDVTLGNDVWIRHGATIMSGVTIGDGAVVATKAVVTRDVRPYAIVGGNPAHEIRRRFDDVTVERLLKLAWWDWPAERILASLRMLARPRVI